MALLHEAHHMHTIESIEICENIETNIFLFDLGQYSSGALSLCDCILGRRNSFVLSSVIQRLILLFISVWIAKRVGCVWVRMISNLNCWHKLLVRVHRTYSCFGLWISKKSLKRPKNKSSSYMKLSVFWIN